MKKCSVLIALKLAIVLSLPLQAQQADTSITHYLDKAETLLADKKFNKAIAAWDSALWWANSLKAYTTLSAIHFRKSNYFESKHLDKKASFEMREALDAIMLTDSANSKLAVLDSLVQFSSRKKNFEDAYNYKLQWIALKDAMELNQQTSTSSLLTSGLDSMQRENAALISKLADEQKSHLVFSDQVRLYSFIGGGILLLLLVFLIRFIVSSRGRLKKRMNEISSLSEQIKTGNEDMRKLSENIIQQDIIISKLQSNSTELWELIPVVNNKLKSGTGSFIADAHSQLEQLARSAGNALPVEKYLELQNTLSRAMQELRELMESLDALREGK
ncbi:MAG: hypothetical protein SH856_05845 [Flavobacteriales bacterium]|nr:hypothetical protein [Flavobacteriales bacterium]